MGQLSAAAHANLFLERNKTHTADKGERNTADARCRKSHRALWQEAWTDTLEPINICQVDRAHTASSFFWSDVSSRPGYSGAHAIGLKPT